MKNRWGLSGMSGDYHTLGDLYRSICMLCCQSGEVYRTSCMLCRQLGGVYRALDGVYRKLAERYLI